MNDRGIDKLFKERLQGYKEAPPSILWEQLERILQSRKRKAWWQLGKVAAILLVIACSLYLLNFWNTSTDKSPLAVEKNEIPPVLKEITVDKDPPNQQRNESPEAKKTEVTAERSKTPISQESASGNLGSPARVTSGNPSPARAAETLTNPTTVNDQQTQQNNLVEPLILEDTPAALGVAVNESSPEPSSKKPRVTITYKRSPSLPDPTLALLSDTDENTRSIKWLWEKAQDLKHTDLGMGAIRAAKDQLLAIEKKTETKN